jgi:transmembrane sensor
VGQAAFESEPLADALGRFAAYHVKHVTVAADAAALRVGGRYSLDDLEGFLAAVEQALPVGVVHGADGSVRVVARPSARR